MGRERGEHLTLEAAAERSVLITCEKRSFVSFRLS